MLREQIGFERVKILLNLRLVFIIQYIVVNFSSICTVIQLVASFANYLLQRADIDGTNQENK